MCKNQVLLTLPCLHPTEWDNFDPRSKTVFRNGVGGFQTRPHTLHKQQHESKRSVDDELQPWWKFYMHDPFMGHKWYACGQKLISHKWNVLCMDREARDWICFPLRWATDCALHTNCIKAHPFFSMPLPLRSRAYFIEGMGGGLTVGVVSPGRSLHVKLKTMRNGSLLPLYYMP